ncbi:MAG: zinc ABC transporter substrate-binding protein, partial [Chromatiales bacterium]
MLTVFVPPAAAAFKVVVSIKPIHSLVAGLMQGIEPPVLLIGKGRNPYDFELTDQQHRQLEQADLLVWVGPELEVTLQQPIAELPGEVEVTELLASPDLKILPSRRDDGRRNPYFWLDNRNALLLLDELTRLLERLDPTRSHVYTRNRAQLLQRLARLDREFEYGYRGLKVGAAVAYYDTQYYFEQAYALKILDRVLESPQDMLDAAALLRVRQHLQHGQATCLLTERGLPTPHLALLSEGMDKEVLALDSLG